MSDLNHLQCSSSEKKKLRQNKIRINDLHLHSIKEIQTIFSVPVIRAMELRALAEFQSLPSVGIRFAHDLISMGFYSLKELVKKDGARLTDQYEQHRGVWADPCVEDQFRLVVHYARHPDSKLNWWDFTSERKKFRLTKGYPVTRPTKPWYELPQYDRAAGLKATHAETKIDLKLKLKKSVQLMNQQLSRPLTLAQLSESAHLSQYHYLRCFKNFYEVTPLHYLTHLRLKKACKLLCTTTQKINQIAPSCGFENESSFSRLFRKRFGTTPAAYRDQFKK